jgi:hypothetical protein
MKGGAEPVQLGHIFLGVGVAAFGVLCYAYAMYWSGRDDRLRRRAAARWRIDHYFSRRVRRGEITKEEWIEETIPKLRRMARAGQLPMMLFWVGLGIYIAV